MKVTQSSYFRLLTSSCALQKIDFQKQLRYITRSIDSKLSDRLKGKQCLAFCKIIEQLGRLLTHDAICRTSLVCHRAEPSLTG